MKNEQPYGILNADGTLQVESNDRELRIILSHYRYVDEGNIKEGYRTSYYVKDAFEWQQTENSRNYQRPTDFLDAIRHAEDFTRAIADIDEQRGEGTRVAK